MSRSGRAVVGLGVDRLFGTILFKKPVIPSISRLIGVLEIPSTTAVSGSGMRSTSLITWLPTSVSRKTAQRAAFFPSWYRIRSKHFRKSRKSASGVAGAAFVVRVSFWGSTVLVPSFDMPELPREEGLKLSFNMASLGTNGTFPTLEFVEGCRLSYNELTFRKLGRLLYVKDGADEGRRENKEKSLLDAKKFLSSLALRCPRVLRLMLFRSDMSLVINFCIVPGNVGL
ncbi:hypothetical protein OGAPHI_003655 [Ogataea philodendri]|uniref:Uncharacterized protein n=1 Tax=Ogataea philodendri TaxID=1378263 RepID=A0A9P8P5L2_9ASCO|nr:uncharacterized protein OGAPHI_003655 [Ogataea philodendri]KAH3665471.1 hypothetical protein OGAPHI_003655 [Ogataea philodendri]